MAEKFANFCSLIQLFTCALLCCSLKSLILMFQGTRVLPVLVQQLQQLMHETYADFDFSASLSALVLFLTLPKSAPVIKVHQKTDLASPLIMLTIRTSAC